LVTFVSYIPALFGDWNVPEVACLVTAVQLPVLGSVILEKYQVAAAAKEGSERVNTVTIVINFNACWRLFAMKWATCTDSPQISLIVLIN
jgi:hypothetical protein